MLAVGVGRRRPRGREALDVDARRRDDDPLGGAPSSSSAARARSVVARKRSVAREDLAAVAAGAHVAIRAANGSVSQHGEHEPEAELRA